MTYYRQCCGAASFFMRLRVKISMRQRLRRLCLQLLPHYTVCIVRQHLVKAQKLIKGLGLLFLMIEIIVSKNLIRLYFVILYFKILVSIYLKHQDRSRSRLRQNDSAPCGFGSATLHDFRSNPRVASFVHTWLSFF
jgi:hypothetical protein